MKIYKEICEGGLIPNGYGLAYRNYHKLTSIFYPIPLNLIIRWWWHFYWSLVRGFYPSLFEKYLEEIKKQSFESGRKCGENNFNEALERIENKLRKLS